MNLFIFQNRVSIPVRFGMTSQQNILLNFSSFKKNKTIISNLEVSMQKEPTFSNIDYP